MDTIAHGLVSYAAGQSIRSRVNWRWLVFFGMWPDMVWLPFTFINLLTSGRVYFFNGPYNISHSLVIWVVVSAALQFWRRNAFAYTWPWALHLMIDLPGHIDMPTPILWPISNWHIVGWFDWLRLPIWLATYALLSLWIGSIVILRRRQKKIRT